jgi:hypothetical protein
MRQRICLHQPSKRNITCIQLFTFCNDHNDLSTHQEMPGAYGCAVRTLKRKCIDFGYSCKLSFQRVLEDNDAVCDDASFPLPRAMRECGIIVSQPGSAIPDAIR